MNFKQLHSDISWYEWELVAGKDVYEFIYEVNDDIELLLDTVFAVNPVTGQPGLLLVIENIPARHMIHDEHIARSFIHSK